MDIRGIEITNQLRSAIRAKLLELGVRYDEELPDYILVMVANKKSRQQMHEDLFLFLEDSTTPFVEWLHDQVLKKLQKVTVAKRKSSRELVPSVVVKQEEEKKKRKTAMHFLDDQASSNLEKDDKQNVQASIQLVSSTTSQEPEKEKTPERNLSENVAVLETQVSCTEEQNEPEVSSSKGKSSKESSAKNISEEPQMEATPSEPRNEIKRIEEKRRRDDSDEDALLEESNDTKKLKSSVIKPRITSVVSVKNRLGVVSPKKRFESSRDRGNFGSNRHRNEDKRPLKNDNRTNFSHSRGFRVSETDGLKKSDLRSRLGKIPVKQQELQKFSLLRPKDKFDVRNRLGMSNKTVAKEQEKNTLTRNRNIKNRLGPLKNHFNTFSNNERNEKVIETDDEDEEEELIGPIKSRIIAVNKPVTTVKDGRKRAEMVNDDDEDEEETKECKLPSKVIVTPRPLKPLQPIQKHATQSLLLRAVAEANLSVVRQKNPEPSLTEKRPVATRLRTTGLRKIGNNLSVCLNQKNRFVMEKIQVELTTDSDRSDDKNLKQAEVTEEQLGVVKSLFQRGDNNPTFLVTLNGYNNENKDYLEDDEEEGLEMEVNENDEMTLSSSQIEYVEEDDLCINNESPNTEKNVSVNNDQQQLDNNEEKQSNENVTEKTAKKRKLSPIVYTRSPSPKDVSIKLGTILPPKIKKTMVDSNVSVVSNKLKEKCRYWPNCTLGNKCAYYHPPILCSAFPACKFGDKCAYQHPKCKFGTSCIKLRCVFSHPLQQCKYHPFCTKPGCTFLHPRVSTSLVNNPIKQRAKFTWKRQK